MKQKTIAILILAIFWAALIVFGCAYALNGDFPAVQHFAVCGLVVASAGIPMATIYLNRSRC